MEKTQKIPYGHRVKAVVLAWLTEGGSPKRWIVLKGVQFCRILLDLKDLENAEGLVAVDLVP